jgi:hypothetical protein
VGAIIFGGIIYIIFSNLFVSLKVTAAIIATIMSILIFGLTIYYLKANQRSENIEKQSLQKKEEAYWHSSRIPFSNISFVCLYIILIIFAFLSQENQQIFIPWDQITGDQTIRLISAILISLFAPGYAIINILDRKHKLRILPKLLIVYILSVLVTGLIGYITGFSGLTVSNIQILIVSVHVLILSLFVLAKVLDKEMIRKVTTVFSNNAFNAKDIRREIDNDNKYKILVFASLFALVLVSTYYIYGDKIIGDQWFHHGRSSLFLSGVFRDIAVSGVDDIAYPPFEHAFLATFIALSGIPSANAFASISFLNIVPVFAFYYFFSRWVPSRYKKAALLASTLFMLSSGFGWLYVLNLNISNSSLSFSSPASALESLTTAGAKTIDIWIPSTFIDVGHPDITSPLIIMALPAGFILLGLIKEDNTIIGGSRLRYIAILVAVSILGYLSHDEFGIFLIVASVAPVIFALKEKNDVFIAILIALSVIIFFAYFFPGGYYKTRGFLGVPLIFPYCIFVIVMWILYKAKFIQRAVRQFKRLSDYTPKPKTLFSKVSIRFVLGVVIVSIVAYLYALSFIILYFQLPQFDLRFNTLGSSVIPWHLYPLRLGVSGLIGLSFILSYMFKKFEKEIFIFGIIAITAFLLLPQYLEIRSNKYIMAAMDAFASLMLFKILFIQKKQQSQQQQQQSHPHYYWKTLLGGFLIGLVITSSSFSTLMYVGYSELGLKSHDLLKEDVFVSALPRRIFPSDSEVHLLSFLRSNLNLKHDENVALSAGELSNTRGLGALFEGFLGIPLTKISQSKLALEESTFEGFYKLLDYTNTRYIVLTKSDLDKGVSKVVSFALENFKRPYEDNKYTVLSVPDLRSPLPSSSSPSEGDVALIFQSLDNYNTPLSFNKSLDFTLFYPNSSFQSIEGLSAILKSIATVWYNTTGKENPNYIESSSKTIAETDANDNHHGIVWYDGFKTYYAFLRQNSLSIISLEDGKVTWVPIESYHIGKWVTLKVAYINGMINLFLDNVLKIQIPQVSKNSNISKIGLRDYNNIAEYLPVRIGRTWPSPSYAKEQTIQFGPHHKYDYYYSLSVLALSNTKYDIFADNDFSAFSKKNIVLTSDPVDAKPYLDYIKNGGTIILLNSNNDFRGEFENNLLCIKPLNETAVFDSIANSIGDSIKVSGISRNIGVNCPNSTSVTSFYMNDGKRVAPFAVEREYGKGRIIFVNSLAYFESILKYPKQYFMTLGNLSSLIDLKVNKFNKPSATLINIAPIPYFAGNLTMSGQVGINSSSLFLTKNNDMVAERISLLNQTTPFHKSNLSNFNNAHIRDLKIYGAYSVIINSSNLLYTPSPSQYDYIPLTLPYGSNMTINLSNNSRAEMRIADGTIYNNNNNSNSNSDINTPIQLLGGSRIELNKINNITAPLLVKSPEIKVTGKTTFQQVRSHYPDRPARPWTDLWPLQVYGKTIMKLDHVSDDRTNVGQLVTYFKWIEVNANTAQTNNTSLAFKGEILKIPWQQVMSSYFNTRITFSLIIMAAVAIYIAHSYPKIRRAIAKV